MSEVGGSIASSFIHLHVHSAYSLAEGAIPVKTLVKKCALMGMPAIAITDSSNLFGFSYDNPPPAREVKPSKVSDEERMMVLQMLQDKKISVEEADKLLSALEK